MKHTPLLARLLALLLAALMLNGMLAVAETAQTEAVNPSYDVIYTAENPIPDIADRVRPAIVQLITKAETWDAVTRVSDVYETGYGSACYFRALEGGMGGYLLTNYHVVEDGDAFVARWLDGTEMDAELVGYDDGTDIAVLKFGDEVPKDTQPLELGDSDALRIGELAIIVGNPSTGYEDVMFGSVSAGIISGLEREDVNVGNFSHHITTIQTDAALTGGYSGGALLNARGEMVGIPVIYTLGEGMNFCIPISPVKDYIEQIIDNGNVVRPRMGVTVISIDGPDEAMRRFPPCGAQVYSVEHGTPADKAGLQEKDIITEANGERVKSSQDLVNAVDKCGEGDTMELTVYRYNYDLEGNLSGGFEELHLELQLELID